MSLYAIGASSSPAPIKVTPWYQIRKEYSIYPDFLYNPGRKKALEHFLEHKFIFQTEEFRTQYETKARENIKREIELL